ncbi:hypothetical protein A4X06_0g5955 [Tilletia controversa]|uniref:Uncharacterized protein n=1 Tax=Tilletia controversa TaxID=13291 RepID=A0A8X7MPP8_9BASI|nr:hypothetical protein A4X06_0g5955 [Tilletia controversa]
MQIKTSSLKSNLLARSEQGPTAALSLRNPEFSPSELKALSVQTVPPSHAALMAIPAIHASLGSLEGKVVILNIRA